MIKEWDKSILTARDVVIKRLMEETESDPDLLVGILDMYFRDHFEMVMKATDKTSKEIYNRGRSNGYNSGYYDGVRDSQK